MAMTRGPVTGRRATDETTADPAAGRPGTSAPPPRAALARLPTPLHDAPRLAAALGLAGRLLVKRDDLTGFAVAGNKTRPLEMLVADALLFGADTFITGGAPSSNFCAAAAAAARWAGMRCVLMYAGLGPTAPPHPNLSAATAWGADIRWTGVENRTSVDAALAEIGEHPEAAAASQRSERAYVVPRGGASPLGATGYHRAAVELDAQLAAHTAGEVSIVVAVGSGGTAAGLLAGSLAVPRRIDVLGASVSRPPAQTRDLVLDLARGCADLMGSPRPGPDDVVCVDARGPGHGIASDDGRRAQQVALETEGLLLDPVYSAKALAAMPVLLGQRRDDPDVTTVFWHTGGLLDAVAGWTA